MLLFKQHFIHNTQLILLATVAYIGVVFIVLSLAQLGQDLQPHDLDEFQGFLLGFFAIFGVLYVGHSFPALRSKESTMNYLLVPASLLEKFIFEFVSRVGLIVLMLPILYWITFHLQGFLFTIFTTESFESVNIQYLVRLHDEPKVDFLFWIYVVSFLAMLFGFVLAFTGSAMFTKQPLVKTLFSLAIIIIFYIAYTYVAVVHLGVGEYNPPESMWLLPMDEARVFQFVSAAILMGIVIIMFAAYRKLKEREV